MANFLWGTPGSAYNLLTTEMNSLAVNTPTAAGPQIDNSTNKYQLGALILTLASAAFVAGNIVNVYLVPSNDLAGTAYPTFTSAAAGGWPNYLAATIAVNGSTAAQKEIMLNVWIPPGKFKAYVITGGGCPTLASSGNTLDLIPTPPAY